MKSFLFLLVTLFVVTGVAEARPRKRSARPEASPNFSVSIPTSEVDVQAKVAREEDNRFVAYEFGASSWTPGKFTRPSFSADVSDFKLSGAPQLFLSRIAPIERYSNGAGFWWRVGLGFANLERTGLQRVGSGGANSYYLGEQNLGLLSLRVGVEYRLLGFFGRQAQPYLNAHFTPVYAFGAASPFDRRVASVGFPFEFGGGLLFAPHFLKDLFGLGDGALGAGAQYTVGSVDGSSLAGFGALGFVQFTL